MSKHCVGECQDCKWWGKPTGTCSKQSEPDSKLHTSDGYEAIETEPDFGCVHWEEKKSA